jgi:uncharacterized protein (TIGR02246 family)
MTRLASVSAALFLAAGLSATVLAQEDAEVKAIRQVIGRYEQALNASDAGAVAKLFTDDAVVMAPNNPPAVGAATVRAVYEGLFKAVKLEIKFAIDEAKPLSDRWAYVRSRSKFTVKVQGADAPPQPDANQELFLLEKSGDGQWRIARYSFSSTNPSAKAAAAKAD